MAHHTAKTSYKRLSERLNKFPQGVAPSELLYRILAMLFSEDEARHVAQLPVAPFKVDAAVRAWRVSEIEAGRRLDELAGKSLLVDMHINGDLFYFLPPPMAGFFEFSMMRTHAEVDQGALAELFYQYINVEDDFIRQLYQGGATQLGRALVHEPVLPEQTNLEVLDHERASAIITAAETMAVGVCYCRHKMHHLDRACEAPLEMCMAFDVAAETLLRHGLGREVEGGERLELLHQAYEHNLLQFGENVRERVQFICNCCGCCCETLDAARRFALLDPVHTTRFRPVVDSGRCNACGVCLETCPVEAIVIAVDGDRDGDGSRRTARARVDEAVCLGCGLCARACARAAVTLVERDARIVTPLDSAHRTVMMAIERGKLQNLVFSEQARAGHRALAAILGVILRLPPIKQVMATEQVKSRYLEALIRRRQLW